MKIRRFISLLVIGLLVCMTALISGCTKSEEDQKTTAQNFVTLMAESENELKNMDIVATQSLRQVGEGKKTLADAYRSFQSVEHTYSGWKARVEKFETKGMPEDVKKRMDSAKKLYIESLDEEIQGIQIYEEIINNGKATPKQDAEASEHFKKRRMKRDFVRDDIKAITDKYGLNFPKEWQNEK